MAITARYRDIDRLYLITAMFGVRQEPLHIVGDERRQVLVKTNAEKPHFYAWQQFPCCRLCPPQGAIA